MHPEAAARTRAAGDTELGGTLQAAQFARARGVAVGGARPARRGAPKGTAALGAGQGECPPGAGPPTQLGTPRGALQTDAVDGAAAGRRVACPPRPHKKPSVVTPPITQTRQTLMLISDPQPRPRLAGWGNGSQAFACESAFHQPAGS